MMSSENPHERLRHAYSAYSAGDPAAAFSAAIDLLSSPVGEVAATLVGLCCVRLKRYDCLPEFADLIQHAGFAPMRGVSRLLNQLLERDDYDALQRIEDVTPHDHGAYILALYYAACAILMKGDRNGALAKFSTFDKFALNYLSVVPFNSDVELNVVFRQGTVVAAIEEVERRIADRIMRPSPCEDFQVMKIAEVAEGPLYFTSGDARYVKRFFGGLALSLGELEQSTLHVHVTNSDAASMAAIEDVVTSIPHVSIGISTGRDNAYGFPTAYACARFWALSPLLKLYSRSIVALDIDIQVLAPLPRLLSLLPPADFACFETGRREPASVYQASLMVFGRNEPTLEFLDALQKFCWPMLDQVTSVSWLLDQGAIFSVLNRWMTKVPSFQFLELGGYSGSKISDMLCFYGDETEKQSIKLATDSLARNRQLSRE